MELGGKKSLNRMMSKLAMDKAMKIFDDEIKQARRRISTRLKRHLKDGSQSPPQRTMKLKFTTKISEAILTGEEIKGEGGARLEVALVDGTSGETVDDGPESSAIVEIVLLKRDSDVVVPDLKGKKPFLNGDVTIRLERGVGVLYNLKLRHGTIKLKPPVFRLGARVVGSFDGVRIEEAKTEAFTAQTYRKKYYNKHEIPSLSDEVSRLHNIGKGGKIYKRLQCKEIRTVEDFLILLLINPDELKRIVKMGPKIWEGTISHARASSVDTRKYCYVDREQAKGVVFDVLGKVLGLYDESHCSPPGLSTEEHKACADKLLATAYENWSDVKPFDDLDSLQQHLITCLSTNHVQPLDISVNPDIFGSGREAFEMVGESSGRRSNASFHSLSSAMNSVREDFSSFGSDMVDIENIYDANADAVMHSPFDPETFFSGLHEYNVQLDPSGCEESIANGDTLPEVVQTGSPPKRWKKLLCVSRWFLIRKRVSVDVCRDRKKQKIE